MNCNVCGREQVLEKVAHPKIQYDHLGKEQHIGWDCRCRAYRALAWNIAPPFLKALARQLELQSRLRREPTITPNDAREAGAL
jgi:hypothetical protein